MSTWTTPDAYRPPTEIDLVNRAARASRPVDQLLTNGGAGIHRTLRTMRTWINNGIRANRTDTSPTPTPIWCDLHHQDRRRCPIPENCPGRPYRPGHDPVGELAADHHDPAHTHHTELLDLLDQRARIDTRITTLAQTYATSRPPSDTGPGPDDCTSCYRWRKTLTPIDLRPDGRPRYRGLCRWCGTFRAEHGQLPPLTVLDARFDPAKTVTPTLIRTALRATTKPNRKRRR